MRSFVFSCILIVFSSCASSKTTIPVSPKGVPSENGTSISVDNPTAWNVYFERGQMVRNKSRGNISLLIEDATLSGGFDILYEIPLSGALPLFCKGDHRTIRELQKTLTIKEPNLIENYGVFIKLVNKADNAVSFYSGGTAHSAWEQRGSPAIGNSPARTDKREFSTDETAVFNISHDSGRDYVIRDSRKNIPLVLSRYEEKNYVYTFEYGSQGLELTDERPLHRVGEGAWTKTLGEASGTLALAAGDRAVISLFAPGRNGLVRHDFDSAGNAAAPVRSGGHFEITAAVRAGDGFFAAGYEKPGSGSLRPVARLLDEKGSARAVLEPSSRRDSVYAYFLAAAPKDSTTWLTAGSAGEHALNNMAYARLVREDGGSLTPVWELRGADFDQKTPPGGPRCGDISSAVYDAARDRWLVTGKNIEYDSMGNPITGSWTAVISGGGAIQTIDLSFKGMSFNKIVLDGDGYYLAGEEAIGAETRAVLVKHGANGARLWRSGGQVPAHSWYQDALVDNKRIVLGGVMRAKTGSGQSGVPFIEALDTASGALLWREELTLAGTALVTGIAPAPDYGYVLALCGIANDYYAKPFVIARVNARGKLLK